eukprot:768736-Hanusia_phi.AAC.3
MAIVRPYPLPSVRASLGTSRGRESSDEEERGEERKIESGEERKIESGEERKIEGGEEQKTGQESRISGCSFANDAADAEGLQHLRENLLHRPPEREEHLELILNEDFINSAIETETLRISQKGNYKILIQDVVVKKHLDRVVGSPIKYSAKSEETPADASKDGKELGSPAPKGLQQSSPKEDIRRFKGRNNTDMAIFSAIILDDSSDMKVGKWCVFSKGSFKVAQSKYNNTKFRPPLKTVHVRFDFVSIDKLATMILVPRGGGYESRTLVGWYSYWKADCYEEPRAMVGYGSVEAKVEEEMRMRRKLPSLPLLSVFVLAAVAILAVVLLHSSTQGRIEEVEFPKDNLGVINVLRSSQPAASQPMTQMMRESPKKHESKLSLPQQYARVSDSPPLSLKELVHCISICLCAACPFHASDSMQNDELWFPYFVVPYASLHPLRKFLWSISSLRVLPTRLSSAFRPCHAFACDPPCSTLTAYYDFLPSPCFHVPLSYSGLRRSCRIWDILRHGAGSTPGRTELPSTTSGRPTLLRYSYPLQRPCCDWLRGQALAMRQKQIERENAKFARKFSTPHTSQYTGVHESLEEILDPRFTPWSNDSPRKAYYQGY